jgi:Set1/Ash2 histone methyltransferase complex subunit ASH2
MESVPQDPTVVQLSRSMRAPQITLGEHLTSAVGHKGYRMVRATHGVSSGSWYFEVRVGEPLHGEDGHTRLGWCTEMGELQAPVGFDINSYGYRDVGGSKFHKSVGEAYGESYGPGDVIGCHLRMGDPAGSAARRQRISIKGQEFVVEEERPRVVSTGSAISFFKNGIPQGVAFSDVYAEVYYPAVSLFKAATVMCNFGPDFAFPPQGIPDARPMSQLPATLLPPAAPAPAAAPTMFTAAEGLVGSLTRAAGEDESEAPTEAGSDGAGEEGAEGGGAHEGEEASASAAAETGEEEQA